MGQGDRTASRIGDAVWRFGLPGFVASGMITVGALGVGWLPLRTGIIEWPIVDFLRTSSSGLALSHILVFAGIALLLQTWLILGRTLVDQQSASGGGSFRPVDLTVILTMWSVPLLASPPMFSRDAYSYYSQ